MMPLLEKKQLNCHLLFSAKINSYFCLDEHLRFLLFTKIFFLADVDFYYILLVLKIII